MSKKGFLFSITIFSFILILICICCISLLVLAYNFEGTTNISEKTIYDANTQNQIAVIDIKGVIASSANTFGTDQPDMVDIIMEKLDKAYNNSDVKAIILRLNTPGGTVFDSDKISKEVKRIKTKKPVIALLESSATSGGYYIASSASSIVASDTTVTGSIGVITQIVDLDGLYDKLGINVITITNTKGDVKAFEHLDDPTSKEYKILVEVLDDNYNSFINTVSEGRNMKIEDVEKLADGSIFSGKKAKELNLIDEIGGLETAISLAKNKSNITNAKIVLYYTKIDPFSNLFSVVSNKINPFNAYLNKIKTQPGIYYYYLPETVANN